MARIRSVKPEFWEDDAIGMLSRDARLLYIATWNMADDEGLLRWSPAYVKANAFMYDDDLTVEAVAALMAELVSAGLICSYVGGKARQSLAWIIQFARHQKPNRPQPSKLPPPSIQNGDVLQAYVRRDGNLCQLCKHECAREHDQRKLWPSLDHITPRSEGGSDYPSNIQLSHTSCNKGRRDRPVESFTPPAGVRALTDSVNDSVSDTLPVAVPEGLGVGGVRNGPSAPLRAAQTDHPKITARDVTGAWVDAMRETGTDPSQRMVGEVARTAKDLLTKNDPAKVLEAAKLAGTAGYTTIDRQLAMMNGRSTRTLAPPGAVDLDPWMTR
jgi:5-methylcytosine-specific restriction endonuclease McrA